MPPSSRTKQTARSLVTRKPTRAEFQKLFSQADGAAFEMYVEGRRAVVVMRAVARWMRTRLVNSKGTSELVRGNFDVWESILDRRARELWRASRLYGKDGE